jgi:hypothetical protein
MSRLRLATSTALMCGLLLLAGCAGSDSGDPVAGATPSSPAATPSGPCDSGASPAENPYGGVAVDPPAADEPVLVAVDGKGAETSLTLDQMQALGTEEIQINEPFVKSCQTFTAVPLEAVLKAADIPTNSGTLSTVALNDYVYDGSIPELVQGGALIAIQRAGQEIPVDQGGPIRIIFPDDSPMASNLDAWNWSLIRMEAK